MRSRLLAGLVAATVSLPGCALPESGPAPGPDPQDAARTAPGPQDPGERPVQPPAPPSGARGAAALPAPALPIAARSSALPWFVTRLANGMTVIIEEVRSRPVVWVGLEVLGGSRDELPNERGGAHFLEHVFYMGTPTRKRRQIRDEIEDRGGNTLAATDFDRTEYWALCRTEDFPLALDGIADGARNARIDPAEVEKERTIINDELRQRIDDPQTFAYEELHRLAFQPHPYARRRAGEITEALALQRDDLYAIYKRHYRPDQFVLIITGDVNTAEALALVREKFGDMQNPDEPVRRAANVPPATGFEYGHFTRATEQTYIAVGCPVPGMAHPDAAACDMLLKFLEARLYTTLVLTQKIATSVNGSVINFRDLGLLTFTVTPANHADAPIVEREIYKILARVSAIPTGRPDWDEQAELARYQRNQRLAMAFDQQDAGARGNNIAWGATMGTLEHLANYDARIDAVTLSDIGRCTRVYCSRDNLNCVVVGPDAAMATTQDAIDREEVLGFITFKGQTPDWAAVARTGRSEGWAEFTLVNGVRVLVGTAPEFPLVSIGVFTRGGSTNDPLGREGRGWLANSMLLIGAGETLRVDGTMGAAWNRGRFSQTINRLGSRFWKSCMREHAYHLMTVTKADLRTAMDMLSAGYLRPTYSSHEIPAEIKETMGALRASADSLHERGMDHARRLIYGEHHPYAIPRRGTLESVPALTRKDLVEGYAASLQPGGAVVVLYGDITAREGHELARAAFEHWKPSRANGQDTAPLQDVVPEFDKQKTGRFEFHMDKEQAFVALACQSVAYGERDYPAADLARSVAGQWAFKELIYDKKIAYSAGCILDVARNGGGFFLFVQCRPEKIEEAANELRALARRLAATPVPAAEFAKVKRSILGNRPLQLQRGSNRVLETGANAVIGLSPDYTDRYLAAIEALTPAQVQAATRRWLKPNQMALVIVHRDAPKKD